MNWIFCITIILFKCVKYKIFHSLICIASICYFFLRKFLFSSQVAYHTPPRFPVDVIRKVREGASLLFQRLHLRDFARIDGWFLPPSSNVFLTSDGKFGRTDFGPVLFTDINLVGNCPSFEDCGHASFFGMPY